MRLKLWRVLLLTYGVYFFLGPVRQWLHNQDISETLLFFSDFPTFILVITSFTAFASYSVATYWVMLQFTTFWKRAIALILVIFSAIGLRYFLQEMVCVWLFGFDNYYDTMSYLAYFIDNLYYAFIYCFTGGYAYYNQKAMEQELNNLKLQTISREAELALLKGQLNPHFLFNTLNNITALVSSKDDRALTAIQQLSSMLRYAIYEGHAQSTLYQELDFMKQMLYLEKLRYRDPVYVCLPGRESLPDVPLMPFLLIPFFENALKHGVLNQPEQPVRIHLSVKHHRLYYRITNHFSCKEKDQQGGLGLDNLQKRLKLLHEDFSYHTTVKEDVFTAHLEIPIA